MMKMDIRKIFFRFSGLSFCLVLLSLAHEVHSEETINVASLCDKFNGTVDLRDRQQAILHYEEYGPMECKILLSYRVWEYVVISLYEWDLKENDKLVFRDGYTEVSLSGKSQRDEEKSFIFRGQTTIHFSTNDTFSSIPNNKFTFSYTASKTGYPKCKKSDFVCNNKICLNNSNLICDGKNNCGDWSDEIDCDKKCSNNEFECANRKCIPKYKLCNDRNDCGDMSDEEKCNRYCNLNSEFKCNNSMCISSDEVCDKKNDCGDWSDEINCHRECDSRQFPCINRKCIDNWKVCNGFDDCGDNSDERKCRSCSSLEFKCSNRLCISNNLVCNNRNDCGDNSDERGCRSCSSLEFKCSNRLCISKNLVCNNLNDCGDNSDERGCRSCSSLEFECSNRLCISKNLVCNNRNDCGDNSDERDCNVAGGNVLEEKNKSVNPWYIAIIVCAVLLAIVVVTFFSVLIRNRVADKKKKARNQLPNYSANSGVHHVHTPNLMGRIRQSFRSGRQTSSPSTRQPVEMQTTTVNPDSADVHHVNPPNLLERVRQSFRSGRQTASPSTKPPVEMQPTTAIPEPQIQHVSSMYPQLHSSADSTDVHHVNTPNLLERVRQSFRSGRQSTPSPIQPSDHISSSPVTTGEQTYQVPSMYPQIQSGFDNPEFKIEE